ncbi:MAG: hypothetical protein QXD03_02625 [Candidatus Anstonellales archaeon]
MKFVYTSGIEESLKNIFKAVLIGGLRVDNVIKSEKINVAKVCIPRFIANFPSNIFQDEYAIFYDIIVNLNVKKFSVSQLNDIIDNNRDLILKSPYVDLSRYSLIQDGRQLTDDEKVEAFKADLIDLFIELSNEYVTEEDFNSSCEIYVDWFKSQFMLHTAQAMSMIMSELGYEERKPGGRIKKYKGYEDAQRYYNEKMKILKELSEENRIEHIVLDEVWLEENLEDKDNSRNILFGTGIDEIDSVNGKFRRGNVIGILGPPKGGKTRFCNYLVNKALMEGYNVCIWTVDGAIEEWIASQLSVYIRRTQGVYINSDDILQGNVKDSKLRSYVYSAKTSIAMDNKLGKMSFIRGALYVEDFIDILEAHYENENPFDVVVIDSLVNLLSRNGKGKVERISEGYMLLKQYVTNQMKVPALAIVPAQLKQSVVDVLRKNPDEDIDVTAGAESAETIRTPDTVIGLFSTKEERNNNLMKFYSVASRHSANFEPFFARCELGCCWFESDPDLNK